MSLDPNKLDLYGDNDENDIFFPGQFDFENNELLNQMLKEIQVNSISSSKNSKITKWLSIISIIISLAFGFINLLMML